MMTDDTPPLTADQRLQQAMAAVAAKFGPAAAEMLRRHVEAEREKPEPVRLPRLWWR